MGDISDYYTDRKINEVFDKNKIEKLRVKKSIKYHKTKDGRRIKLEDMDLNHLKNTIKMIERKADEGIVVLSGGGSGEPSEMWMEKEDVYGERALQYMNYYDYVHELSRRNKLA